MAIYLDDRSPVTVCPACRLEVDPLDLEVARDGAVKCGRCAMEPWEHALAGMHGDAQFLGEQMPTLTARDARALAKALTALERVVAELANQAAQRMEQE